MHPGGMTKERTVFGTGTHAHFMEEISKEMPPIADIG
jgi:3-polyprenyl-4-hydroxybenzoate decarboxylase